MEPHREEQPKAPEPGAEPKPKRFRIVKLEERIAPKHPPNRTAAPPCQYSASLCVGPCW
jgi:hypothetical protein